MAPLRGLIEMDPKLRESRRDSFRDFSLTRPAIASDGSPYGFGRIDRQLDPSAVR
jgi:hypothetical protein